MNLHHRMGSASHSSCRGAQRGVVLFIALISLVVLSLAAVALIRSVDTNSLIAGNLAFRQSATASADAGLEAAIARLTEIATANAAANVMTEDEHPLNQTDLAAEPGYFSSIDPGLDLRDADTWDDPNSVSVGTDSSGNTVRYIVQRMCRDPNLAIRNAGCLFSSAVEDTNGQQIPLPQEICLGAGCPAAGQTPMIRITARAIGPRNTVSYVQAFVY